MSAVLIGITVGRSNILIITSPREEDLLVPEGCQEETAISYEELREYEGKSEWHLLISVYSMSLTEKCLSAQGAGHEEVPSVGDWGLVAGPAGEL